MLTYNDVYELLSIYANHVLPLFADRWSRWPVGAAAAQVSQALYASAKTYSNMGMADLSARLAAAADTVTNRRDY